MTDDESVSASRSAAPTSRVAGGHEPRSAAELSGEHRLMLAVLEDAIALYVKYLSAGTVARHEGRRAWAWLKSRDRSSPFAFECICDLLGFDPGYIRRGLRAARARPAEAAARFAVRHHGCSATATPPRPVPAVAPGVASVERVGVGLAG